MCLMVISGQYAAGHSILIHLPDRYLNKICASISVPLPVIAYDHCKRCNYLILIITIVLMLYLCCSFPYFSQLASPILHLQSMTPLLRQQVQYMYPNL